MLQHTWDRARCVVDPDRIVTVVTAGQEHYLDVEPRLGAPSTVVVQPANRGTAPGLLLPLLWIAGRTPSATVTVLPADHFIWEEARFARHVRAAVGVAAHHPDRLILLGAEAEGPEPSYGWIAPGERLRTGGAAELYTVQAFWEKPDRATAARLFSAGCLWNTLILVGKLEAYFRLAKTCLPEVFTPLQAVADCLDTPAEAEAVSAAYQRLPPTNLSQAMLAEQPDALLVSAVRDVCWCDWGEPERILRTLSRFDVQPAWLPVYAREKLTGRTEARVHRLSDAGRGVLGER